MNVDEVRTAIERGGSIREAAKLLGKSYTSLQWWLARNSYRITHSATIEKIEHKEKDQS
jgi:molybdenum-dependent DNA-binding transcriptional regulator ModE